MDERERRYWTFALSSAIYPLEIIFANILGGCNFEVGASAWD